MAKKAITVGKIAINKQSEPLLGSFISELNPQPKPIAEAQVQQIQNRALGSTALDVLGTINDVNALGYESLLPALVKSPVAEKDPMVRIGSSQCQQPYEAAYFNCSALSFGPMGKKFILALNRAAFGRGFFQNTGEAGISPYHLNIDIDIESPEFESGEFFKGLTGERLKNSGDLVWQLGNGYFGCRNQDGSFNKADFELKAGLPPVKMIEIKLSQGVEPASKMPVKEVTRGIAQVMGIQDSTNAVLQSFHNTFSTPVELLQFVQSLRTLSGGKPIGIKMGVSHRVYIMSLCKAMLKTGIVIDFITIDGMEAGTAAAQSGILGFTGTALHDAVLYVHNALTGCNLRSEVKIIASGHVFDEKTMITLLARGADLFASARSMMLAVGCNQQLECHKGICSRGIATQEAHLQDKFNLEKNIRHISNYHQQTIQGLKQLVALAGLSAPSQIQPFHVQKRINYADTLPLDEVYTFLKKGALLSLCDWQVPVAYKKPWKLANPDTRFSEMALNGLPATK